MHVTVFDFLSTDPISVHRGQPQLRPHRLALWSESAAQLSGSPLLHGCSVWHGETSSKEGLVWGVAGTDAPAGCCENHFANYQC